MSRQFVEMTRLRIEGLLAAFPKLIGTEQAKKQHTFVETESVRYVYQPLDGLYLLLITNRASNIVEDLETLRLLSKVVPSVTGTAGNLTDEKVIEKAFDLLFAFDEVVTAGGYREAITLQQIRTNMEMESHEEKLHNMIKLSKMETAKDQATAAAKAIKDKLRDQPRSLQGYSSADAPSSLSSMTSPASASGGISNSVQQAASSSSYTSVGASTNSSKAVKGMSLGFGSKGKGLEDALMKEDKLAPIMANLNSSSLTAAATETASAPLVQHPLMLSVTERVTCHISKDGQVEEYEVRGALSISAQTEEASNCIIRLQPSNGAATKFFSFNTHPKINKALYERNSVLQLKDSGAGKGFPSGRPVSLLKWTSDRGSDDLAPIKINCWPEEEARGQMNVSIDFTADLQFISELHNVTVNIPLGTSAAPNVISADGRFKHVGANSQLVWELDLVDQSTSSAALEFSIAQRDSNAFFPITVSFVSNRLYCPMDVVDIVSAVTSEPIAHGYSRSLASEEYIVG